MVGNSCTHKHLEIGRAVRAPTLWKVREGKADGDECCDQESGRHFGSSASDVSKTLAKPSFASSPMAEAKCERPFSLSG